MALAAGSTTLGLTFPAVSPSQMCLTIPVTPNHASSGKLLFHKNKHFYLVLHLCSQLLKCSSVQQGLLKDLWLCSLQTPCLPDRLWPPRSHIQLRLSPNLLFSILPSRLMGGSKDCCHKSGRVLDFLKSVLLLTPSFLFYFPEIKSCW